jgi:Rrf2 family transcriptional regulator, cysteine metabolism repressor
MFSTKSEYGVRVMVQLARRRGKGPVPLAEVAQAENLPLAYLEQLVSRLRRAELVSSTRGAHGGYELTRDPAAITMAEVVHALGERIVPMPCVSDFGESRMLCNHEPDGYESCATKLLWTRVHGGIERALEQTTLAELALFAERGAPAPKPRSTAARPRARLRTTTAQRPQEKRPVRNG